MTECSHFSQKLPIHKLMRYSFQSVRFYFYPSIKPASPWFHGRAQEVKINSSQLLCKYLMPIWIYR